MKIRLALLLILFAPIFSVSAQEIFSLHQCVEYALNSHRSIKVADNDVQVAYARKKEGQSAYMPQINGLVQWDYNIQLQESALPDEFIQLGQALGQSFPNTVAFGNHFSTIMGLQLDQFLYNKSYIDGIKAIKPSYELAELKKVKTEEDVIYNTVAAYYQILLVNEQEKLLLINETRLNKILPIVELQYNKGVVKQIDVDKVKINLIKKQKRQSIK